VNGNRDLRAAGHAFISAAFAVFTDQHVIPTPIYHPYVAVGRDYFGGSIMGLDEYQTLETVLNDTYSGRFADPLKRGHPEFASTYMFSFLEACVTRCALDHDFSVNNDSIDDSIDELIAVLETTTYEAVCTRHVSHMTTLSGAEAQIGNVTVVPEPNGRGGLVDRIQQEIRGAARAWNRDVPRSYDPPHSLLIARESSEDPDLYEVGDRLSKRIERFLLVTRLLTAGTVHSEYEVRGTTTLVGRANPQILTFREGWPLSMIRRTVRLTGDEGEAFRALDDLIQAADVKREGMVATSFDVAMAKFNRSHASGSAYEHLVDLATALEAALLGGDRETEGLTLRLRNRVAALLATDEDPAGALFDDVGQLYRLRSSLVHGGQVKETDMKRIFARISTISADDAEDRFGVALAYAVDRMRDLVRRAILARLCLAAEPEPVWPFHGHTPVDAFLADDAVRVAWRSRWREGMSAVGAESAADKPRSAVDFVSRDDL
jgi:Apea-like HEPN